jgi:hypothetical protein
MNVYGGGMSEKKRLRGNVRLEVFERGQDRFSTLYSPKQALAAL